jgi:hypothetical protein
MDYQPPTTSSVDNPSAFLIGDTVNTPPHIESHVNPSPPAELPLSPPDAAPYDIPPGSIIDNIIKSHDRPQSPTTLFNFSFGAPCSIYGHSQQCTRHVPPVGQCHLGSRDTPGL